MKAFTLLVIFLLPVAAVAGKLDDPGMATITPKRCDPAHRSKRSLIGKSRGRTATRGQARNCRRDLQRRSDVDVRVSGTADAPIWIVAAKDAQVIVTRPDDQQMSSTLAKAVLSSSSVCAGLNSQGAVMACASGTAPMSGWINVTFITPVRFASARTVPLRSASI